MKIASSALRLQQQLRFITSSQYCRSLSRTITSSLPFNNGVPNGCGSGIGSDSSMISSNHRCNDVAATTQATPTTPTRDCRNHRIMSRRSFSSKSASTAETATDSYNSMEDEYGELTSEGQTYQLDQFQLESGVVLKNAQLRYQQYGAPLNASRDNVLVVCHALTGNASLHSWWGDLLGPGKAFDTSKYFIVCCNILGSCYGSTSPQSINPDTSMPYSVDFPDVSVKDTVRFQLLLLKNELKISSVKAVIGGSFGGMQAVEFAVQGGRTGGDFCQDTGDDGSPGAPFVKAVIPIACGAAHSAWQIAVSEVQRQAIYADPNWRDRPEQATAGLAVARQMGMISYRTAQGYQGKFGRKIQRAAGDASPLQYGSSVTFQAQSYLQYQGAKFLSRFDPVTYVKMTEQMDSHDIARGRAAAGAEDVLQQVEIPALVMGIDSDVLYPLEEQEFLARHFLRGILRVIHSPDGHDGFLLEQEQVGTNITEFLNGLD